MPKSKCSLGGKKSNVCSVSIGLEDQNIVDLRQAESFDDEDSVCCSERDITPAYKYTENSDLESSECEEGHK